MKFKILKAIQKYSRDNLSMTRKHDNYQNEFNSLNDKEIRRKKARKMLESYKEWYKQENPVIQSAYQDFFDTTMAHLKESRNEKQ